MTCADLTNISVFLHTLCYEINNDYLFRFVYELVSVVFNKRVDIVIFSGRF